MIETIPLQSAGELLPALPSGELLGLALLAFLAGMATPDGYAFERIQGFGRAIASKIPYRPPPGMEKEEALRRAVRREESVAVDDTGEQEGGG